ncbi:AbrB/MazE/SpoVT family DNA-binding domain-containing protein [Candidatus Woesearchaeota archaeon]|nr:AbrB/MazE/SpoVT family DNA-binding domain-containing protein [Candidatus Woesearchaeota archaeon]
MDVAITRMSSKGQIVIPSKMREGIQNGEKLMIIQNEGKFIMKKVSKLDENLLDEIEFANRTQKALKRYEKGQFKTVDSKDFLDDLEKW